MPARVTESIVDEFKQAGLILEDRRVPGREQVRPGLVYDPRCLMIHWTGAQGTMSRPFPSWYVVSRGRHGIPGPLYGFLCGFNGVWRWVSDGYTNNAGRGVRAALDAAMAGQAQVVTQVACDDTGLGNRHTIAASCEVGGSHMRGALFESWTTGLAVILGHMGWTPGHMLGHSSYTSRKVDWSTTDHIRFRNEVTDHMTTPDYGPYGPQTPQHEPGIRFNDRWVADCPAPGGGAWLLFEDGAVAAVGGARYYGGANLPAGDLRMRDGRLSKDAYSILGRPVRIRPAGSGYTIITDLGYGYTYNENTV